MNVCLRFLPYRLLDGFELLLFFSIRYTVQAQDFFYRAGGGPFFFHAGSMALTLTPSRLLPVWEEKRLSVQLRPELATPGYVTCFCRLFDIKKKNEQKIRTLFIVKIHQPQEPCRTEDVINLEEKLLRLCSHTSGVEGLNHGNYFGPTDKSI